MISAARPIPKTISTERVVPELSSGPVKGSLPPPGGSVHGEVGYVRAVLLFAAHILHSRAPDRPLGRRFTITQLRPGLSIGGGKEEIHSQTIG